MRTNGNLVVRLNGITSTRRRAGADCAGYSCGSIHCASFAWSAESSRRRARRQAIAESAARLCQAEFCNVFRFDGELIHFMHSYGYSREAVQDLRHFYPMRPGRRSCAGRAILNGKVEQVPDVRSDPEYAQGNVPDIMKISSIVAVPMLREHRPIGAIALIRAAKGTSRNARSIF